MYIVSEEPFVDNPNNQFSLVYKDNHHYLYRLNELTTDDNLSSYLFYGHKAYVFRENKAFMVYNCRTKGVFSSSNVFKTPCPFINSLVEFSLFRSMHLQSFFNQEWNKIENPIENLVISFTRELYASFADTRDDSSVFQAPIIKCIGLSTGTSESCTFATSIEGNFSKLVENHTRDFCKRAYFELFCLIRENLSNQVVIQEDSTLIVRAAAHKRTNRLLSFEKFFDI